MITGNDIQRVAFLEKNLERALENVARLEEKAKGLRAMTRTLEKYKSPAKRWRMVVDLWRGMKSPSEFVKHVEDYTAEHSVPLADAVKAIHRAWDQCGRPGAGSDDRQMEIDDGGGI